MAPPPTQRLRYVDVLRGMAIVAVLFHHLPAEVGHPFGQWQVFGGRGVDLFFVLSGFLIGTTCLQRAALPGTTPGQQAGAYWLLRTARIWPLYFGLLALYALCPPGLDAEVSRIVREQKRFYLLFLSNDLGQPTLELGVLWSLAIEEQFYVLVGLLVLFSGTKRETLAAAFTALALTVVAVALRNRYDLVKLHAAGLLDAGGYTFRLYHSTLARMDQLGLGLLASVAAARFNATGAANAPALARASTWGAILAVAALITWTPQHPKLEFTFLGVAFALLLLWVQRPAARALVAGRAEAWVVGLVGHLGKLSFGLYLLHPTCRRWTTALLGMAGVKPSPESAGLFLGCWLLVTWGLAWAVYSGMEEPLLRWARARAERWLAPPRPAALSTDAALG